MRDAVLAWRVEWAVALHRRRLLVLDVAIPLLLVAPLALADAPPPHEAAVLAVLMVMFGVFGSAIPLVRDGASGLLLRFVQSGMDERSLIAGRVAAQAALDGAQLAAALALALGAAGTPGTAWPGAAAALLLALLAANALGAWAAAVARSLAEAALFSAVISLFLLHAAGVFRTPAPGSGWAAAERWSPFRPLHESLLAGLGGAPATASPAEPLVGGAVLLLSTWLAAPLLTRLLTRAKD